MMESSIMADFVPNRVHRDARYRRVRIGTEARRAIRSFLEDLIGVDDD